MVASRLAKIFSIAVIVTFLLSSVESAKNDCPKSLSISSKSTEKEKNVIVVFKSETAAKRQYDMFKNCLDAEVDSFDKIKSLSSKNSKPTFTTFGVVNLFGLTGKMTPQFAKELEKMDDVNYIEDDGEVRTLYAIPSSHLISRAVDTKPTFNIDRIDQAKRPPNGKYTFPDSAGQGVNIFVVDTGINTKHSEFGNRAKFGGSFCDGCNNDDENGHGTHVASIAAGKTLGVARKANLIAVRVLDAKGSGSNSGVIKGLEFVGKEHSNGKNKNSVVNMSLGGAKSQAVNDAVAKLTAAGVHVVVAAGNESQDACNASPASEPSVLTIGATEKDSDAITDFSNFGKCVDTFAPGRDIEGADFQDENGTVVFSGTSQACPHVAGTVALIIAKDGNKSPAAMATEVKNLSTKGVVKGLKNGSPDSFVRIPSA